MLGSKRTQPVTFVLSKRFIVGVSFLRRVLHANRMRCGLYNSHGLIKRLSWHIGEQDNVWIIWGTCKDCRQQFLEYRESDPAALMRWVGGHVCNEKTPASVANTASHPDWFASFDIECSHPLPGAIKDWFCLLSGFGGEPSIGAKTKIVVDVRCVLLKKITGIQA